MLLLPKPGAHKQPDCSSSASPGPSPGVMRWAGVFIPSKEWTIQHWDTQTGTTASSLPLPADQKKAHGWEVQDPYNAHPSCCWAGTLSLGRSCSWISAPLTDRIQTDTHLPSCPHSSFSLHGNQAPSALGWVLKGMLRTDAHRASAQLKYQELKKPNESYRFHEYTSYLTTMCLIIYLTTLYS